MVFSVMVFCVQVRIENVRGEKEMGAFMGIFCGIFSV